MNVSLLPFTIREETKIFEVDKVICEGTKFSGVLADGTRVFEIVIHEDHCEYEGGKFRSAYICFFD